MDKHFPVEQGQALNKIILGIPHRLHSEPIVNPNYLATRLGFDSGVEADQHRHVLITKKLQADNLIIARSEIRRSLNGAIQTALSVLHLNGTEPSFQEPWLCYIDFFDGLFEQWKTKYPQLPTFPEFNKSPINRVESLIYPPLNNIRIQIQAQTLEKLQDISSKVITQST